MDLSIVMVYVILAFAILPAFPAFSGSEVDRGPKCRGIRKGDYVEAFSERDKRWIRGEVNLVLANAPKEHQMFDVTLDENIRREDGYVSNQWLFNADKVRKIKW